jgi:signal transduction histidine kinase
MQIDPTLSDLVLDPARLRQMLYNLLSNAIKFTGAGGRVVMRARPQGDEQVRIEVEDNGVGIAETDLPKLFHRFQQVHSGLSKAHGGTGLGLALTRHLAEMQGGSVGVRSTAGAGSVFHLVLPRRAHASEAARAQAEPQEAT